jgi:ribosomal protein S18 acetylase RimI-like enzyme
LAVDIRILKANDTAMPDIALLMEEMQAHYGVACPPRVDIIAGLRDKPQGSELLVAEQDGKILGFCSFSPIYPGPGLRPGIFLKELYVSGASRGQGVGRSLMRELALFARQRGLSRIDWTADAQNDRLLSFYDEIGGMRKTEKLYYRLDGEALAMLGDEQR